MKLINDLNDMIAEMYQNNEIDGKDIKEVARRLDLSNFTVWQYAKKDGKSISTAEAIYNEFKAIVDRRRELVEKNEIINDYVQ